MAPRDAGGDDGIDQFNAIAAQCSPPSETCPTGQLAIVLDSVVQSAPTIQQPSFNADGIAITGDFTESEAKTSPSCSATARCR